MKGALSWPFIRLYSLTLLYFSANSILNVFIPLRGDSLGATNTTIGIIMGAYLFTTMFFRPWAGKVIDRHGPIKVLRTILLINGAALVLYAFTGLGGYLAARILQGVCTAFFSMALQLGIIDALPDKDRSQGISMYSLCAYMPGIVGPLLALGIWQSGDMNVFTIVMISIAVLTGVVGYSARMEPKREEDNAADAGQPDAKPTALQSFGRFFTNSDLMRCGLIMLSASMVFGACTTFIPLYASQVKGGNAGVYLMLTAATVVLSRFLLRKRIPSDGKWHTPYMMGVMLLLSAAAGCVSFAVEGGAAFFYVGAVLMGTAQALIYPTLTTYLSFVLPKAERGVLLGLFIATADLGVSMGGMVMGPVADLSSYSTMYTVCSILGVLMIGAAFRRKKATAADNATAV